MTALTMRITLRTVCGTPAEVAYDFERSMRAVMDYFAGFAGTLLTLPLWLPTPTTLRFLRARAPDAGGAPPCRAARTRRSAVARGSASATSLPGGSWWSRTLQRRRVTSSGQ
jgi:hypothetical protein